MNLLKIFLHRSKLKKYNIKSIEWELVDHSFKYCTDIKYDRICWKYKFGSTLIWRNDFKRKMSKYLVDEI